MHVIQINDQELYVSATGEPVDKPELAVRYAEYADAVSAALKLHSKNPLVDYEVVPYQNVLGVPYGPL